LTIYNIISIPAPAEIHVRKVHLFEFQKQQIASKQAIALVFMATVVFCHTVEFTNTLVIQKYH